MIEFWYKDAVREVAIQTAYTSASDVQALCREVKRWKTRVSPQEADCAYGFRVI